MSRLRVLVLSAVVLLAHALNAADDVPLLSTSHGIIHKIEKESLTIKPRAADGKFEKELVLKLTGTSHFSVLSTQKRGDKVVLVQKDIDAKNLAEKQPIAVVYVNNVDGHVLLAAVVQNP